MTGNRDARRGLRRVFPGYSVARKTYAVAVFRDAPSGALRAAQPASASGGPAACGRLSEDSLVEQGHVLDAGSAQGSGEIEGEQVTPGTRGPCTSRWSSWARRAAAAELFRYSEADPRRGGPSQDPRNADRHRQEAASCQGDLQAHVRVIEIRPTR